MSCKCAIHQYVLLRSIIPSRLPRELVMYMGCICFAANATPHDHNYVITAHPPVNCISTVVDTIRQNMIDRYCRKIIAVFTPACGSLLREKIPHVGFYTSGDISIADVKLPVAGCECYSSINVNARWLASVMDLIFTDMELTLIHKDLAIYAYHKEISVARMWDM